MAEEKKVEMVNPSWNKYYVTPLDKECEFDINIPLTVDMFKQQPKDITKVTLDQVIGDKFTAFRGQSEREKEETSLTEEVTCEYFEGTRYVGLLFAASYATPCKTMLRYLRNFYSDINLEERRFEILLVPTDRSR